jgi:hypothetical protein
MYTHTHTYTSHTVSPSHPSDMAHQHTTPLGHPHYHPCLRRWCMCVYTHVCMYVCIYVCMHVCVCMYVCANPNPAVSPLFEKVVYVCIHIRMYVCVYVCIYVCMYVFVCTFVQIQIPHYHPCLRR